MKTVDFDDTFDTYFNYHAIYNYSRMLLLLMGLKDTL